MIAATGAGQLVEILSERRSEEELQSPSQARALHVAMVDEELPYPATSGKRIRTLNLTLRLAQRHRITYLCHRNSDPHEARQAMDYFRDHGIKTIVVDRSVPPKTGFPFYARLAANLLSNLPYSVSTHTSRPLRQALHNFAAQHPVDLWHCEWTPYAQSLPMLENEPHLVMAHNVESLIWQRYFENEPNLFKRWYIGRQYRKFERFERRAFSQATCTVAVSPDDAVLIRDHFGSPSVTVVDNGVDTTYFQPTHEPRQTGHILFLGSLDWRPNLDGVKLLVESVFPTVLARESTARLMIVGRNPPEWLRDLVSASQSVELHANVSDVRPFLNQCGVMAVPLRIGGGSRLKILEALASSLPVVSTRVGAEGLWLQPGQHLVVVKGIEDMAEAILHALRSPQEAREQAERGREVVLAQYDWDSLARKMEAVWWNCVNSQSSQSKNGNGRNRT